MEFDVDLTVEMSRVNNVVGCKMGILANNTSVTVDDFQVTSHCLKGGGPGSSSRDEGPGLRFQIVPVGLQLDESIDVRLSWQLNGSANIEGA